MTAWYKIENSSEIPSPSLLIYEDRVRENIRNMVRWVGDVNRLRPHVKTHKLPQIVRFKLEAGITKFKTSTIAEAEMTAAAGGTDILLAYQPVGPNVERLCRLAKGYPGVQFSTIVDNSNSLLELSDAAVGYGLTLPTMVDLDVGMHRTGIAIGDSADQLYRLLCHTPGLKPAGIHAYDGHLHAEDDEVLRKANADTFKPVWEMVSRLRAQGFAVPKIIAGGTPTSGYLAAYPDVEVGAGTSVLWDSGQGTLAPNDRFQAAAVLLTRVISRPTANRICLDLGHKAVASEMPHPRVKIFGLEDALAVIHSEEHLVLEIDDAERFPVGAVLYGIPRHICPTVALQSDVWVVREGHAAESWPVVARARFISV